MTARSETTAADTSDGPGSPARRARTFVVLMGVVALFGDMTYEGARGLVGPYLGLLGASATAVAKSPAASRVLMAFPLLAAITASQ